ncbi:MAG: site-specific integrase [Bryobacteraceae bacterium]|jgi:site-specific recombinase XerD
MSDQHFSHEEWLSKLRDHLDEEHYAARTSQRCLVVARRFLASLEKQHLEVAAATLTNVGRYLEQTQRGYRQRHGHAPDYSGWRPVQTSSIHMLLRLVQGQWPPVSVAVTPEGMLRQRICGEYGEWMGDERGLAPITVLDRCAEARRFLDWLGNRVTGEQLSSLAVFEVDAFVKQRASSLRRRTLNGLATNVRSILRWLHMTGQTTRDLSSAVITPPLHAFENIPSAFRAQEVKQVVAVTRQDRTPKGIRDYAILMLLSTYGVRAGEITSLRLDDIDWRKEIIRIRHSKTGATSYLPLRPEVGEAILKYLQKSRPKTAIREMFIRCRAPYRPFKRGSSLYGLVQWRLAAAGVVPSGKRGPHAFRHARAVSMLRATVPVKEIGDLLGHRASDSTMAYLKLATEDLRAVALEIPTGVKA